MSSQTTTPTPDTSDTSTVDTDRPDGDQPATDRAATAGDRLWAALRACPGATADRLAGEAGIGRSTAAKILARWVADGTAARVPTDDGKRSASRFTIPATSMNTAPNTRADTGAAVSGPHSATQAGPITPDPDPAPDSATDEDGHSGEAVGTAPADTVTAATVVETAPAEDETSPPDRDTAAPDGDDSDTPSRPVRAVGLPADAAASPAGNGTAGAVAALPAKGPRLAPGALHGLVEDYLREHPEEVGPTKIGHALSRSTGAVANALERLVATGYAVRTKEHPKRYALAAADDTGPNHTDSAPEASSRPEA